MYGLEISTFACIKIHILIMYVSCQVRIPTNKLPVVVNLNIESTHASLKWMHMLLFKIYPFFLKIFDVVLIGSILLYRKMLNRCA